MTIGGRDLRDYRQEDVRRAIAVAGQDAHLFSTQRSATNVRLARPERDATPRSRTRSARARHPGLGRGASRTGSTRSSARRAASSRAASGSGSSSRGRCSPDAPVLVLDEPTAHLDTATASALIDDVLDDRGRPQRCC